MAVLAAGTLMALAGGSSPARAQVSPGPLSRPHAALDDASHCFECHARGEGSQDQRCLDCHEAIRWLVARGRGLHAREGRSECATCHPEHAGRDLKLIAWAAGEPRGFDHARSGWPLEGKHAALRCEDCHKAALQNGEAARLRKAKRSGAGWLGLDPECVGCHEDVHRGALGTSCLDCHALEGWKPAPRFDHAKTAFPLQGRHATVECARCHLAPAVAVRRDDAGRPIPVYKPLPHECASCHRDPHVGQLGSRCASCHVADDWKKVPRQAFDHSRTRYPLVGKHAAVACASCHDATKAWGKKPPFATCGGCHADAHAGKATLAGAKADCGACHTVEGWEAATYTVARHREAAYPLEGAHRGVKCEACHRKNPPGVPSKTLGRAGILLRPRYAACRDCHDDAHGGQLAGRADRGACESCHRVDGWKPSTFSPADHAALRFPLEGRHATAQCAACHGPVRPGLPPLPGADRLGRARVALAGIAAECRDCHFDPHRGRFSPGGEHPVAAGCRGCHDTRRFRPSTLDPPSHRAFSFALEGAHLAVPCAQCHAELKGPPSKIELLEVRGTPRPLTLRAAGTRCESCHETPHGDQFRGRGGCKACHDVRAFVPASRFDHQRDAGFALDGAHRAVPCARCHPVRPGADGRAQTLYRPVAHRCQDCHAGPSAPAPAGRQTSGASAPARGGS